MIYLSTDDLIYIGERAIGSSVVVRDRGLLAAASTRPQSTWQGSDTYVSIAEKAAALTHSLVSNHALVDGSKRLGLAGLIAFVGVNGWRLSWSNDEAFEFIMTIADAELADVPAIAVRIESALRAR